MHDAKGRIIDVVHTAPDGPETASQPWVPLPELLPINIARAALDPNRSEWLLWNIQCNLSTAIATAW
jgi:hypothetical protein